MVCDGRLTGGRVGQQLKGVSERVKGTRDARLTGPRLAGSSQIVLRASSLFTISPPSAAPRSSSVMLFDARTDCVLRTARQLSKRKNAGKCTGLAGGDDGSN